jgi:hypothetical protein
VLAGVTKTSSGASPIDPIVNQQLGTRYNIVTRKGLARRMEFRRSTGVFSTRRMVCIGPFGRNFRLACLEAGRLVCGVMLHLAGYRGQPSLWSRLHRSCRPQKQNSSVKRPPSPGDIHDVTRRARNPSSHGTRRAICVCGRCPERCPGRVPGIQGQVRSEACRDCNGLPTPW